MMRNPNADRSPSNYELPLPPDVCDYQHQITGYGNMLPNKIGPDPLGQFLYSPADRCVYKPIQEAPKGPREVAFYEAVFKSTTQHSQLRDKLHQLSALRKFLPGYLGVHHNPMTGQRYIRLHDLLDGFALPSIMDIKMGVQRHEPRCNCVVERPDRYAYRQQTGFFVTGMRLWHEETGSYELRGKRNGREVTPENMRTAVLHPLLSSAPSAHRLELVRQLLAGLEELRQWFESQRACHFYASSILLGVECSLQCEPAVLVRMVDFTHVVPAEADLPDVGFLLGLGNLTWICREFERDLLQASFADKAGP